MHNDDSIHNAPYATSNSMTRTWRPDMRFCDRCGAYVDFGLPVDKHYHKRCPCGGEWHPLGQAGPSSGCVGGYTGPNLPESSRPEIFPGNKEGLGQQPENFSGTPEGVTLCEYCGADPHRVTCVRYVKAMYESIYKPVEHSEGCGCHECVIRRKG